MYIERLREMILPPSENTVGVFKLIIILVVYYISSRVVTLFKIIGAAEHV